MNRMTSSQSHDGPWSIDGQDCSVGTCNTFVGGENGVMVPIFLNEDIPAFKFPSDGNQL